LTFVSSIPSTQRPAEHNIAAKAPVRMPSTPVTRHLREMAKAARALEQEASTPESRGVMKKLALDYELWAERIERTAGLPTETGHGA
jgi:hypothetical protein